MAMAGLKPHHRIAVGVSGGPDSVALCVLTSEWKKDALIGIIDEKDGYIDGLLAIVVDHGLRKESKDEANVVYDRVSKLGVRCEIASCDWLHGRPKLGHLQEAARDMRYQILQNVCVENQISVLLIAHHADDQAELFILRLSRNSGVLGLSGTAFVSELFLTKIHYYGEESCTNGILLVRPLLDFSKEDMYEICQKGSILWVEDPTNQSPLFTRNRIRLSLRSLKVGTFRSEVQALISACRKTRSFVDRICSNLRSQTVTVNAHGYATIDVQKLDPSSVEDICLSKFFTLILQFVSQRHRPVRGRTSKLLLEYVRNFPIKLLEMVSLYLFISSVYHFFLLTSPHTSLTAAACYICPAPRSNGTKILVCCSVDSPSPSEVASSHKYFHEGNTHFMTNDVKDILMNAKSYSDCMVLPDASDVPFLQATTSESILGEAKKHHLLSESTHESIFLLQKEETKHFNAKTEVLVPAHESMLQIKSPSTHVRDAVGPGQFHHFMDRFLLMWRVQKQIMSDILPAGEIASNWNAELVCRDFPCSSCVVGQEATVRTMVEADWLYLARLSKGQTMESCQEGKVLSACKMRKIFSCSDYVRLSAQTALLMLKSIPLAARRGLPVLVNSQGLLLSIPNICFRYCPYLSVTATYKPRVPLGGGHSSFL
ncbi:hypothetical protein MKW94_008495 [Papaver nudicaule]|uniref:tRNA(Ile)-lysidine synthetase n=1 Tax=Papaver nudicaule TaxID=74823 RepID=A0AA41V143_PAPNU|nr:hypothetical protein [Papaver nudicaule]